MSERYITGTELLKSFSDINPNPLPCKWGQWTFCRKTLSLVHKKHGYEIDLEDIKSSAKMLDVIFQIRQKDWADDKAMCDLLRAFDNILDPQANFCSFGKECGGSGQKLAKEYRGKP